MPHLHARHGLSKSVYHNVRPPAMAKDRAEVHEVSDATVHDETQRGWKTRRRFGLAQTSQTLCVSPLGKNAKPLPAVEWNVPFHAVCGRERDSGATSLSRPPESGADQIGPYASPTVARNDIQLVEVDEPIKDRPSRETHRSIAWVRGDPKPARVLPPLELFCRHGERRVRSREPVPAETRGCRALDRRQEMQVLPSRSPDSVARSVPR